MIGSIIQQKRKEAGMTQAQLADRLGVSAPAVNRWEKDLSFPDATLLAPLARCLKTDLNELFSFYDSLSAKERELIVDKARMMLLKDGDETALQYIDSVLRENLSDGNLYKEMADMLFGWHTIKKAQSPPLYLAEVAEYYERALELLPDKVEIISGSLMNVYGEMGEAEKAEEAWSRLPQTKHDKQWAHAELHYLLKDYGLADEIKIQYVNISTLEKSGAKAIDKVLSDGCKAIVCATNSITVMCLRHLQKLKKNVPEDVTVMGFDGGSEFDFYNAPFRIQFP